MAEQAHWFKIPFYKATKAMRVLGPKPLTNGRDYGFLTGGFWATLSSW